MSIQEWFALEPPKLEDYVQRGDGPDIRESLRRFDHDFYSWKMRTYKRQFLIWTFLTLFILLIMVSDIILGHPFSIIFLMPSIVLDAVFMRKTIRERRLLLMKILSLD